jgi:hypothetical protein
MREMKIRRRNGRNMKEMLEKGDKTKDRRGKGEGRTR